MQTSLITPFQCLVIFKICEISHLFYFSFIKQTISFLFRIRLLTSLLPRIPSSCSWSNLNAEATYSARQRVYLPATQNRNIGKRRVDYEVRNLGVIMRETWRGEENHTRNFSLRNSMKKVSALSEYEYRTVPTLKHTLCGLASPSCSFFSQTDVLDFRFCKLLTQLKNLT